MGVTAGGIQGEFHESIHGQQRVWRDEPTAPLSLGVCCAWEALACLSCQAECCRAQALVGGVGEAGQQAKQL